MSRTLLRAAIAAIVVLLAVWSGTAFLRPAPPVPASAGPERFSAERAMRHVEALASAPRPIGSAGHAAGREYILAELRRLGLEPQVQEAVSAFRFPGAPGFGAARVRNVVARIEGEREEPAVLLNAHYDGGNTGVAAGDCGACVAAVLETARALTRGPRPGRDVILVLSDAEEMGDHGAHAFATQHPWMRDVGLALNYEAMGTTGPGSLYVTGPNNAALVRALADAVPRGFGTSFVTAIFNAIPEMRNACDLQDYLDAGKPGLGFVLHGDTQRYHTVLDTPANLAPRSLQSFGDTALGMARAWGERDLAAKGDAIFFPLAPFGTFVAPEGWSLPLALITLALMVALGWRARGRGARPLRMVGSALLMPLVGVVSAAFAVAVWAAVRAVDPTLQVMLIGTYATPWYVAALSLFAAAAAVALAGLGSRWLTPEEAAIGSAGGLAVLGVILAFTLPGMAYAATLPALAAVAALLPWRSSTAGARLFALFPVFTAAVLTAPILAPQSLIVAFMARLEGMSGMPLLALPSGLAGLAVVFTLPFLQEYLGATTWRSRLIALLLLVLALLALVAGTIQSRFSEAQPRPESVRYELDSAHGGARWITNDVALGGWSGQFIPAGTARRSDGSTITGGPPTFVAPAPMFAIPPPTVALAKDQLRGGNRQATLHLASPRGAPIMEVRVSAGAPILAASIGGEQLDLRGFDPARRGELVFYASGFGVEGLLLQLNLARSGGSLVVDLADMSDGLPGPQRTRPKSTMPTPGATLDGTVVRSELSEHR